MKSSSQRRDWTNIFGETELPVYLILSSVSDANYVFLYFQNYIRLCFVNINYTERIINQLMIFERPQQNMLNW
jgi:hypothetical protein